MFASNAGSASVSTFAANPSGSLSSLGQQSTGAGTVDSAVTANGRFLYVQTGGNGIVDEYAVSTDGALTEVGSVTVPGAVGGEGIVAGSPARVRGGRPQWHRGLPVRPVGRNPSSRPSQECVWRRIHCTETMTARPPALRAPQPDPDAHLLARLRSGDEQAFMILVDRYQPSMLRIAAGYVPSRAVAEEVVQDAWVGFLRGLDRFEARSSVRTWLFRILVNRARSAAARERRTMAVDDLEAAVDAARFDGAGTWALPPELWTDLVDNRLMALSNGATISTALADLPTRQREVVILRDVDGLSSSEVCGVLDITDANQRVLLHRGRSRLRQLLESRFGRV